MSHNCQLISTFGLLALEKRRLRLLLGGKGWTEKCKSLCQVGSANFTSEEPRLSWSKNRGVTWFCQVFHGFWSRFTLNFTVFLKRFLEEFWVVFSTLENDQLRQSFITDSRVWHFLEDVNMLATGGFLMPFYKFLILEGSVSQFAIEGGKVTRPFTGAGSLYVLVRRRCRTVGHLSILSDSW